MYVSVCVCVYMRERRYLIIRRNKMVDRLAKEDEHAEDWYICFRVFSRSITLR